MTIKELTSDYKRLIKFYKQAPEGISSSEYLRLWLNARKYSKEEIEFIKYIIYAHDAASHELNHEGDVIETEFTKALSALNYDLSTQTYEGNFPQRLEHVNLQMLTHSIRKSMLKTAEQWLIDNLMIDSDGKWNKTKGMLAAFLNILIEEKIIKSPMSNVEKYFTKRYAYGESLGTQSKKSKAEEHYPKFAQLRVRLSKSN